MARQVAPRKWGNEGPERPARGLLALAARTSWGRKRRDDEFPTHIIEIHFTIILGNLFAPDAKPTVSFCPVGETYERDWRVTNAARLPEIGADVRDSARTSPQVVSDVLRRIAAGCRRPRGRLVSARPWPSCRHRQRQPWPSRKPYRKCPKPWAVPFGLTGTRKRNDPTSTT